MSLKPVKYALLVLVGFVVMFALSNSSAKFESKEEHQPKLRQQNIDSIAEKTTVEYLDMGHFQLFIDTSKNSAFQKLAMNWQANKQFNHLVEMQIESISDGKKIPKFELDSFPIYWLALKKYNGELLLYDPCDGIDQIGFFVTDSFFGLSSGYLDIDLVISGQQTGREIELQLKTHKNKSQSGLAYLKIEKSNTVGVYILSYTKNAHVFRHLVTPKTNVGQFNVLVEHCPIQKVPSQAKFDEIDFDKYFIDKSRKK